MWSPTCLAKETLKGTVEKIIVEQNQISLYHIFAAAKKEKTVQGGKNQRRKLMKILGVLWLKGETSPCAPSSDSVQFNIFINTRKVNRWLK